MCPRSKEVMVFETSYGGMPLDSQLITKLSDAVPLWEEAKKFCVSDSIATVGRIKSLMDDKVIGTLIYNHRKKQTKVKVA